MITLFCISLTSFKQQDIASAKQIGPLEDVVDELKESLRSRHIIRMKTGKCSMLAGVIWVDMLTDLERISDHCSNIAGCMLDLQNHEMNNHMDLRQQKMYDTQFRQDLAGYQAKYSL